MNYNYQGQKQSLFLVELKAPKAAREGIRPDFVKLANQMKDSLDKQIRDGVMDRDSLVLGLLIEGENFGGYLEPH